LGVWLLYLDCERLLDNRQVALLIALLYGLLPLYTTVRFWFATSQICLALLFFALSFYADLRGISARGARWDLVALGGLVLSGLSYEAFLPLFLVCPLLAMGKEFLLVRRGALPRMRWTRWALRAAGTLAVIGALLVFKFNTSDRAEVRIPTVAGVYEAASRLVFVEYGQRFPVIAASIRDRYWDPRAAGTSLALAALVGAYLWWVARQSRSRLPGPTVALVTAAIAFVVTGLAYSQFWPYFRPTVGINSRMATAASLPATVVIVMLLALIAGVVRRVVSSAVVVATLGGLLCGYAFLVDATVANWWRDAANRQSQVLRELDVALPNIPKYSAVVLTGYCPWIGPGIVFETDWDTSGVLRVTRGDVSLRGDVLRKRLRMAPHALVNTKEETTIPYGRLFFYDVGRRTATQISSQEAAQRFQDAAATDPRNACLADDTLFGFGTPVW
jgi:hypothetical protein